MQVSWRVSVMGLAVGALACGGGGGGTPTAPTPTPTSITVTSSAGHMFLGASETFTAVITMSNGTTQAVSGGVWGTDAAAVATVVAGTGAVSAVGSGEVTIYVDAQGIRGSKRVRVLPRYQGIWQGTYTVTSCTETGAFIDVELCANTLQVGNSLPAAINFMTQNVDNVSGQTALGQVISDQFLATVGPDGRVTVTVSGSLPGLTIRIGQTWQLTMPRADQLTGTLQQVWTDPTITGQLVLQATLSTWAKVSAAHLADRSAGLPERPYTLRDLAGLISHR